MMPRSFLRKEGFHEYRTGSYKLNYFETASGLKFVLNTDLAVGDIRDELKSIYKNVRPPTHAVPRLDILDDEEMLVWLLSMKFADAPLFRFHCLFCQVYVEYAVKNPMYTLGEPIDIESFRTRLDEHVRNLPFFR